MTFWNTEYTYILQLLTHVTHFERSKACEAVLKLMPQQQLRGECRSIAPPSPFPLMFHPNYLTDDTASALIGLPGSSNLFSISDKFASP